MHTKVKNRREWNYNIVDVIENDYFLPTSYLLRGLVDRHPQQRFGQIICNYICSDYRNEEPSLNTQLWLKSNIFPDNIDFFYEEPWKTFNRINKNTVK